MFCTKCGMEYKTSDKFCANCGLKFETNTSESHNREIDTEIIRTDTKKKISKSIINGRMNRKEFATITFLPYLVLVLFAIISDVSGETWYYLFGIPLAIFWVIFGYFASIRRLHDLNKSAWWLMTIAFAGIAISIRESLKLVGFDTFNFDTTVIGILVNIISIGGMVVFLSLLFWPGTKTSNKFGDVPANRKFDVRNIVYNLQSSDEKLDLKYILWTTGVVVTLAGLIFFYFFSESGTKISTTSHSQAMTEFLGIQLGSDRVSVTLLKGSPNDEIQRGDSTRMVYKDSNGFITGVIDLDLENKVKRICSEEFMYKVFDLGELSSLQEVQSVLGEAPEVSISTDGTMMITTYPERNVAFVFSRNKVTTTCVTSEDRISFIEEYQTSQ